MTSAAVLTGFITYDQPEVQGTHFVTHRLRRWCPATGLGSPHQVSPKGARGAPMAIDTLTSISPGAVRMDDSRLCGWDKDDRGEKGGHLVFGRQFCH